MHAGKGKGNKGYNNNFNNTYQYNNGKGKGQGYVKGYSKGKGSVNKVGMAGGMQPPAQFPAMNYSPALHQVQHDNNAYQYPQYDINNDWSQYINIGGSIAALKSVKKEDFIKDKVDTDSEGLEILIVHYMQL